MPNFKRSFWYNKQTGALLGEDTGAAFRIANNLKDERGYSLVKIINIGEGWPISKQSDIEAAGLLKEHKELCEAWKQWNRAKIKEQIKEHKEELKRLKPYPNAWHLVSERISALEYSLEGDRWRYDD